MESLIKSLYSNGKVYTQMKNVCTLIENVYTQIWKV